MIRRRIGINAVYHSSHDGYELGTEPRQGL